ncbi:MAG: NAD(P)/FAD-dependent oxidoreductase [Gemmatimonadetes bacterium]|nr:NAD(P)/FAD-dependent oxidoreductase [Gemmatimonadota bacterium]MBT7863253.1 NAD(P)/FAD-dependent oxidoreductase [Gemmatimonadota bacterium]
MWDAEYDGIILGAGHNSLVLQSYLCRAGLRVICLENSSVAGGGLRTEDWPAGSGFLHNTHSFYHRALTQMPWFDELDLANHGAHYIEPELNVAMLLRDGSALEWWTDLDRTVAAFAHVSPVDADRLQVWAQDFRQIVDDILIPEAQRPPQEPHLRHRALQGSAAGRRLLEISRLSPRQFVEQEFEHPAVQAGLLFFNGLREVDLRAPGFGHHIPALLASRGKAQMCRGGSAGLARALVASIEAAGGVVRTSTHLRQILVEGTGEAARVTGVETAAGERIGARHFVASGLNPQQTFLELIDPDALPTAWRDRAAGFRYNLLAPLFGLYLNLEAPPHYAAADRLPHLADAFMVILGLESPTDFDAMVTAHESGEIPPTVMWGSCPTQFDPTQAPAGRHTAFMWEKVPYRLQGDATNWDTQGEEHGRRMLETWAQYAPGLEGQILERFIRTAADIPRQLPNMQDGDLLVGALSHGQIGFDRPFPGAGHYRGHLDRLYLCGSCCHPSGNITGLPGYNAAQVLCADLGVEGPATG